MLAKLGNRTTQSQAVKRESRVEDIGFAFAALVVCQNAEGSDLEKVFDDPDHVRKLLKSRRRPAPP